ncbi:MAG: hypothetical protein HY904_25185 [Deltaproteobacteria bacterium]|nr:hypothetical protein [Deltaproteobacteria bacterium]
MLNRFVRSSAALMGLAFLLATVTTHAQPAATPTDPAAAPALVPADPNAAPAEPAPAEDPAKKKEEEKKDEAAAPAPAADTPVADAPVAAPAPEPTPEPAKPAAAATTAEKGWGWLSVGGWAALAVGTIGVVIGAVTLANPQDFYAATANRRITPNSVFGFGALVAGAALAVAGGVLLYLDTALN